MMNPIDRSFLGTGREVQPPLFLDFNRFFTCDFSFQLKKKIKNCSLWKKMSRVCILSSIWKALIGHAFPFQSVYVLN